MSADQAQSTKREYGPGFIVATAVWFGLLVSWVELGAMTAGKYLLHVYVYHLGVHLLWMTPLANVAFFLVPGLLLALLNWRWPRVASFRTCVTILAFGAAMVFASLFDGKIFWKALIVLAAGAGVQAGRIAAAHLAGFRKLVRATLPAALTITVLVAATGVGVRRWREWRTIAGLPEAPAGAPNIVLVILDAARAKNMSVYGYERPTTPNLERLGQRGVVFDWAFSPSGWSLPSHSSFLTGRFPFELNAAVRVPLDATYPTIAEVLQRRGYLTSGFVANMGYTARASGLSRGFAHYEDFPSTISQVVGAAVIARTTLYRTPLRKWLGYYQLPGRKVAGRMRSDFLTWQAKYPGRPFFTFMNFFDAHAPYVPPKEFDGRFGSTQGVPLLSEQRSIEVDSPEMQRQVQAQVDAYDNLIAYLDDELSKMFEELERRGVLQNTIVFVTADHGEEFGEHGHLGHGAGMNTSELHVPLIVVANGRVPAAVRVAEPASLRDIPSTILELAAIPDTLPGASLARYWSPRKAAGSEIVLSSQGPWLSLVNEKYHYTRDEHGKEKLFAYREDIFEQKNLAGTPEAAEILQRFRASIPQHFLAQK